MLSDQVYVLRYSRSRIRFGNNVAGILGHIQRNSVAKKRGNPNWGKPEVNIIPYTGASSFEEVVRQLRLSPAEYEVRFTNIRRAFRIWPRVTSCAASAKQSIRPSDLSL
jgi:hypothetical protein